MSYIDLPAGSGFHSPRSSTELECINPYYIRTDFPILASAPRGRPLVYLDNAATTQKPDSVIKTLNRYYTELNANVHRGVYYLSEKSTIAFEAARQKIQRFLKARSEKEIVFVRGATEGINLVAQTFGRKHIQAGDEIILSQMEHHSNIVPWQLLAQQTGARIRVIPINSRGELLLEEFERLLGPRTRMLAVAHVSNALGTINPIAQMIQTAHDHDVPVLIDGAQSAPHMPVDLEALDCDFYVTSGHKMYGPTGIGILYGKIHLLEEMPPYQGGGEMIRRVSMTESTFLDPPQKFEAGTPDIAGAIGLGAAVNYLNSLGMNQVEDYETQLLDYAEASLDDVEGLHVIGSARKKAGIISFVMDSAHPHDIATILDREGIAVRAGHHCAMPVMDFFEVPATTRVSLSFYNTRDEIDALKEGIQTVNEVFA